jgi:hypothetical protein
MVRIQKSPQLIVCATLLGLPVVIALAAPAQAATLTIGANNVINPLVDDGIATGAGTFGLAPAPGPQPAGTVVTRTTTPVNGQSITYSFTHVNFPAAGPTNFAADTANKSAFKIDKLAEQGTAKATTWGADSDTGGNGLNAILFDFSASNVAVRQFGINLLDFEGGDKGLITPNKGGIPARVVAYDKNDAIVFNQQFTNPSGVLGKGGVLPVTFSSDATDPAISRLLFAVGDDDFNDSGILERWAFTGATFNSLRTNSVPTPALLPGLIALAAGARRRSKAAQ